jgi:hypothetical protein
MGEREEWREGPSLNAALKFLDGGAVRISQGRKEQADELPPLRKKTTKATFPVQRSGNNGSQEQRLE